MSPEEEAFMSGYEDDADASEDDEESGGKKVNHEDEGSDGEEY